MVARRSKKKPPTPRLDRVSQETLKLRHEARALVEEQFCNFDIVWAKAPGFPWWPGVLFHSWDVVLDAGIQTDPKIVAELIVPVPEKVPPSDGKLTSYDAKYKRHCVIMFLDKFNFTVLEINAHNVASFTTHYVKYERAVMGSRSSKWGKKKAEFKRAVVKAVQLLHMGEDYTEEDLLVLEKESVAEKKKKMMKKKTKQGMMDSRVEREREEVELLDDAGDDPENGTDAAVSDESGKAVEIIVATPLQKQPRVRRKRVREGKDIKDEDKVVSLTLASPRWHEESGVSGARKRLEKEVDNGPYVAIVSRSPSPIDLTETPVKKPRAAYNDEADGIQFAIRNRSNTEASVETDKGLRKDVTRILAMEDDVMLQVAAKEKDKHDAVAVASIIEDEEPNKNLLLSPLSSIWMTGVSGDSSALTGHQTQLAYKQDFVWDGAVFTDDLSIAEKQKAAIERKQAEDTTTGRERLSGKRQLRSVQQSQIRQNMMAGDLNPHTMVQCAVYRPKDYVEDANSRSRGGPTLDPPFQVVVHPDAVFVADLHAHLATCEIIGFLGGKWDEASKTLYIQAAFPCRSLVIDGDDGSTDVEMDPGSEIELRGIIENAQLEVVGWYHSHPAFAPDPSVRDIENQTSYQQLFQRSSTSKEGSADNKLSEPFVGLIVGTYDTRRNTPVSLLRFFHTRVEKVSGGACREIYMPYEFIPGRRHFRKVLQDEEREMARLFPMYKSVLQHFSFKIRAMNHQLPMDIRTTPAQRLVSRSSLTRVRACGPTRKRKQSADGTGSKPMKKARARRKRCPRSYATAESQVAVTGAGNNVNLEAIANGVLTPSAMLDVGYNGSTDVVIKRETIASNYACEAQSIVTITASSRIGEENTGSNISSVEELKSKVCSVESQVAEVLVGMVESTSISENGLNLSRKSKQTNELVASSDGAKFDQLLIQNGVAPSTSISTVSPSTPVSTVSRNMMQHSISQSNDAVKELKAKHDVDTIAESADLRIPRSLSAFLLSAVKSGMLPLTEVSVSSRKRTRKPKTTTRNSNQSTSPSSDKVLRGAVHCRTNSSGQAFYDAFRPSGPRFANGGTPEKVTLLCSRPYGPKGDHSVVEGVRYIVVDETMGMTLPSRNNNPSAKVKDDKVFHVLGTSDDDLIMQEIRCFVTSLVEKVAKRVVSEICAGTKASAQSKSEEALISAPRMASVSSGSSTRKSPVNDLKIESTSIKPKFTVNANEEKSTVRAGLQLFGSNGECEDIQTSLQKMAGCLDKLKSSQAYMASVTEVKVQTDGTPDIKPDIVVVGEPKQDAFKVEQNHLASLRTKYGAGVSRCAEQVIALVDYYRDFERRTDLNEIWKARITKLEKIESSLLEYVQYLNIPVALRRDFITDLILYLRESWAITDRRR